MWPVLQSLKHKQAYNERFSIDKGGALRQDFLLQAKSPPGLKLNSSIINKPQGMP